MVYLNSRVRKLKRWIIFFVIFNLAGCGGGGSSSPPRSSASINSAIFSSSSISAGSPISSIDNSSLGSSASSSLSIDSSSSYSSFYVGDLLLDVAPIPDDIYVGQQLLLDASASRFEYDQSGNIEYSWELIRAPDYAREIIYNLDFRDLCLGDNYGQRISGYLFVPEDGNYSFAVSSDDQHQLWLSTSGNAQNARMITSIGGWSGRLRFNQHMEQQSGEVQLQAGKPYYFELVHVQRDEAAHLNVAWKLTGGEFSLLSAENFSSLEDGSSSGPTGRLTREIFSHLAKPTLSDLRETIQYINGDSAVNLPQKNSSQLTFIPPVHGEYLIKLTARGFGKVESLFIPFNVKSAFSGGDYALNGLPNWSRVVRHGALDMLQRKDQCGPDGSACLAIETPSNIYDAGYWHKRIYAEPQTAYLLTAKVRATDIQYRQTNLTNSLSGPYVGIRQFTQARKGVDISTTSEWAEIQIDFATPPTGIVDIEINMGDASGNFYVHSIKVEPLYSEVTRFDSENMILNVYNDIVTLAGGNSVVQAYVNRISDLAGSMAEFSGNTENLQCHKESAWMPKFWDIDALGWSGNPILYSQPPERNITQSVWPASNSIDGIFSHELNHNFDFDPWLFGRHMNSIIETYALTSMNFNRSEVSADQWYQQERDIFDEKISEGCLSPDALTSKLLQFSERHGWSALKQVMHRSRTSYSTPWPHTPYEQYLRWWEELKIETGENGWLTLHTASERTEIIEMFQRLQLVNLKNPATLSDVNSQLLLSHAEFYEPETVGWGRLWRNSIAGCRLQTRKKTYTSGIYAHAPSRVVFNLEGKWKNFTTFVGIARGHEEGSVVAIIKGDGNELYRTLVDYQSEKNITVDIEGVKILELIYEPNGSTNNDWSVWLEPRINR